MTEARPSAAPKTGASAEDLTFKAMPFETALAELEEIVRQLEQGDVPLERSIAIYERGETLKRHCDGLLKTAEQRIQKIATGPDGKAAGVAPLDVE